MFQQPGVFTTRTPRVVAARRLHRRRERDATGLFLAEGPQAVREARGVVELFATPETLIRYAEIARLAENDGARISMVDDDALAALADTVSPQGLVAVCRHLHQSLLDALERSNPAGRSQPAGRSEPAGRLGVVLAGINDPGNAGTVLRTADAAGAGLVVFPDGTVDPYNNKCVRASAGSLFHVRLVRGSDPVRAVREVRAAGFQVLAAHGYGESDLDALIGEGALIRDTVWVFGGEAGGLDPEVAAAADARVRIPIYGGAESLNLAAAAAVCLYASARAMRVNASA